ncbi:hypothetical protein IAG41_18220 [Sphingomonas sp. JC676]|uniref:hypothetical protein n=1 Tax=Sphingomonas sp. JC676 TaxID=2768065 RepID=UPI0016578510|nr:hypothetical protein [Sphingomonas sp. JC676]MBC9034329.1 hypothetical protein [Sphingomonas sp. JC676]
MRTTLITAAAALMIATPAFADDWDFILINSSGKSIKAIEVSPAGGATWQPNKVDPDMKRDATVKAGGRMTVHFDKAGSQCRYDIKATFTDDTSATWSSINVCDNSYITVKYNAAGAPTFTAN